MKTVKQVFVKLAPKLLLAGVILMFSVNSSTAQQAPISCSGLLSEEQLSQLLKAGVADIRVQAFVSKCGLDFAFTPDVDSRLREAGASDALFKLVQARSIAEQQRKEKAAERLAELRRKLGLHVSGPPALKPDLMLDEARQQLVSLRAQTRDIEDRLKGQYPELEVKPTMTKGMFETTAEYDRRVAKVTAEHKEMEEHYRTDLARLTADYNYQISDLLSRKYAKTGVQAKLTTYDADGQLLVASVGGYSYWFAVEPAKAQVWYAHKDALGTEANFLKAEDNHQPAADEITLVDPQTREELNSRKGGALTFGGKWMASVVRRDGQEHLTFDFKFDGETLTGTFQSSPGVSSASSKLLANGATISGTVKDNEVSFTVLIGNQLWTYRGRLTGARIKFNRTMNNDMYSDEFTAEREPFIN
jgi:hypothetical protein